MRTLVALLPLALFVLPAPTPAPPPTGEALIRQMHDRYAGKWYRTLSFIQTSHFADGRTETWYEAAEIPGKLRIDIAPLDSMHTLIFRDDSLVEFRGGRRVGGKPLIHPLMVLGFDVYVQPEAITLGKLRALGYDLSRVHETTWEGRPTYVVGAAAGDTITRQFWIDKERLYFVRSLEPAPQDSSKRTEIRFSRYRPMGGGWLEHEVLFLVDGEVRMREEYGDTRIGVPLDSALFRTDTWTPPTWIE